MANKLDVARGERLCAAMDKAGVGNLELANLAAVSPSTVSQWRKGAEIRSAHLAIICPRLDITADYLLTGQAGPDSQELRFLRDFRSLDERIKQALLRLLSELSQKK